MFSFATVHQIAAQDPFRVIFMSFNIELELVFHLFDNICSPCVIFYFIEDDCSILGVYKNMGMFFLGMGLFQETHKQQTGSKQIFHISFF